MARPVTKTKVRNLTREIRRESKKLDAMLDALASVAGTGVYAPTIGGLLESDRGAYAREQITEMLNVIDGNSAALRELLTTDQEV